MSDAPPGRTSDADAQRVSEVAATEGPGTGHERGPGGGDIGEGSEAQPLGLSPKVVLFWRLPWIIVTLVLAAAMGAGVLWTDAPEIYLAGLVLVLAVGVVVGGVLPPIRFRRWLYWVTDDGIELRHGRVLRTESSIPHFRVQHIDIRQGPLQRWAGIVELVISTASAATDATLPGLEPERARAIRQVVLAHAEADDAV